MLRYHPFSQKKKKKKKSNKKSSRGGGWGRGVGLNLEKWGRECNGSS